MTATEIDVIIHRSTLKAAHHIHPSYLQLLCYQNQEAQCLYTYNTHCMREFHFTFDCHAKIALHEFVLNMRYQWDLFYGVSDNLIRRVQSVQNAAARLLTGASRRDHISPVLRQLHWLPVQRRVDYKLAYFVFSSLSGHAPPYLADDIHLVSESHRRRLRSSTNRSCAVPRTQHTTHSVTGASLSPGHVFEQSSGPLARRGHYVRRFQAWTQNVLY